MFLSVLVTALLLQAAAPGQAQPKLDEFKMTTYQVVFVTKGPAWTPESPEVAPLVKAHREYIAGLIQSGQAHIGGPFGGDNPLRGVYFLSGTAESAKTIAEADPGVTAGRYGFELMRWMGPEGWFRKPSGSGSETLYFGFLVTGSNTAKTTPEETKLNMRAHLDHLDGQAKIGKLVLAGPLPGGGTRRGLIAYRVPTLAEAIERASADPMVKSNRMAPQFYEWTVPAGILR